MKHGSTKRWSRTNAAYLGAFLGLAVAMAHHIHHAVASEFPSENPLVHITRELITFSSGSALMLAAVAELRNRILGTKSSAGRSIPNSDH